MPLVQEPLLFPGGGKDIPGEGRISAHVCGCPWSRSPLFLTGPGEGRVGAPVCAPGLGVLLLAGVPGKGRVGAPVCAPGQGVPLGS
jgi:hypothetical protein